MDSHLSQEEVEYVARLAHTINKALCEATGDDSQPAWEDASDDQKASITSGVITAANYVANSQGRQMNPEESHNGWMARKLRQGWRYGEVKDTELKEHPCLLPWNELPRADRLKDVLFSGIVHFYSVFREEPDAT